MARILITSGPTRQYLDPVRFLTNGSSGRMGAALAIAAIARGHQVTIVSGPVQVEYPSAATVHSVVTTTEMLDVAVSLFPDCDGAIGCAAPCDYMPQRVSAEKIKKTGQPLELHLVETPDVIATLGKRKRDDQWVVGFALETEDHRFRALAKLEAKHCNLMVSNGTDAMNSLDNRVDLIDGDGAILATIEGSKQEVANELIDQIEQRLVRRDPSPTPHPQSDSPQRS
jgi:phosphopantothenoylcysteine decarboxylase / phosphopantothenate---cysteine ligase